jgi:hypothetical protein
MVDLVVTLVCFGSGAQRNPKERGKAEKHLKKNRAEN